MSHTLIEIPPEKWEVLLNLYDGRKKEPSSYSLILNYINWKKKDSTLNAKIYSLDGDFEEDGTFVIIDCTREVFEVFFNTLSSNLERLCTVLHCLDPNKEFLFFAVQKRNIPAVKKYFLNSGLNVDDVRDSDTFYYYIEPEKALAFDTVPPPGIKLTTLSPHHAEFIHALWPNRASGLVTFVAQLITLNDSIGAFDKDGNLVAWCLRLPIGALGVLQVAESHRRQGLGNLVVRYMSKLVASKGEEVNAPVSTKNTASRAMFEGLGFKIVDEAIWVLRPPLPK